MIEVICNDRLGKKIRVKCNEDDTIGDLKKLIAAQVGTRPEKIRIQKWYTIYKGKYHVCILIFLTISLIYHLFMLLLKTKSLSKTTKFTMGWDLSYIIIEIVQNMYAIF